jgi:hypothetical protein
MQGKPHRDPLPNGPERGAVSGLVVSEPGDVAEQPGRRRKVRYQPVPCDPLPVWFTSRAFAAPAAIFVRYRPDSNRSPRIGDAGPGRDRPSLPRTL